MGMGVFFFFFWGGGGEEKVLRCNGSYIHTTPHHQGCHPPPRGTPASWWGVATARWLDRPANDLLMSLNGHLMSLNDHLMTGSMTT